MRKYILTSAAITLFCFIGLCQAKLSSIKKRVFKVGDTVEVSGVEGFLIVPENRKNPESRTIKLKFVYLESSSQKKSVPTVYLEGGSGYSTWEAYSPKDLDDRSILLQNTDLIFLDRRGYGNNDLTYRFKGDFPENFFRSETEAYHHYGDLTISSLAYFKRKNIDIEGYNIEEHAKDVDELMSLLEIQKYNVMGFSYGSHIGMTVLKMFPNKVQRAVFIGADAPNQGLNFPSHLEKHIDKVGLLIEQDSSIKISANEFRELLESSIKTLEENPMRITVRHPVNKKKLDLLVGDFGLALVLRLDIDDVNDLPVIPRLLQSIKEGDDSMLSWFVQKRVKFALGLPGGDINQQLASGVSEERWSQIQDETSNSIFKDVVNFPFSAAKPYWPEANLSFDSTTPMTSEIPTLFITGTLDCRTPIEQTEEIMNGFINSAHIRVENAGHEQAQWSKEVADTIIPSFLSGQEVKSQTVSYGTLEFIPITGPASGHPSINR